MIELEVAHEVVTDRRLGGERRSGGRGTPDRRRGRPRRVPDERASIRKWLFLTPSELAVLRAIARENGQDENELLREAVREYIADFSEQKIFITVNSERDRS